MSKEESKKLFIQTLGCQMNDTDSQHIAAELKNIKIMIKQKILKMQI